MRFLKKDHLVSKMLLVLKLSGRYKLITGLVNERMNRFLQNISDWSASWFCPISSFNYTEHFPIWSSKQSAVKRFRLFLHPLNCMWCLDKNMCLSSSCFPPVRFGLNQPVTYCTDCLKLGPSCNSAFFFSVPQKWCFNSKHIFWYLLPCVYLFIYFDYLWSTTLRIGLSLAFLHYTGPEWPQSVKEGAMHINVAIWWPAEASHTARHTASEEEWDGKVS